MTAMTPGRAPVEEHTDGGHAVGVNSSKPSCTSDHIRVRGDPGYTCTEYCSVMVMH